jgi:hypothetical protein
MFVYTQDDIYPFSLSHIHAWQANQHFKKFGAPDIELMYLTQYDEAS